MLITSTFQTMDNKEENINDLPIRQNIDWIKKAESKIPTYKKRLKIFIDPIKKESDKLDSVASSNEELDEFDFVESSNGELDEFDFVVSEIEQCSSLLHPKSQFTVGVKWKIYVKKVMQYKEFLFEKLKIINEERNASLKNQKANNYLKIFCIREFAPELKKNLDGSHLTKVEKQEIIHMLTGVNKTDSFDYNNKNDDFFKAIITDGEILDRVKLLKSKLN